MSMERASILALIEWDTNTRLSSMVGALCVCVCVCVSMRSTQTQSKSSTTRRRARGLDVSGWESNNRILNHQEQHQEEYHDDDRTSISNQLGDILILGNILKCFSNILEIG